jgi:enterochelin esterase-like enzyme
MSFATTELSPAAFDATGLRFITVRSEHLSGRGDITVFVPEGQETRTDLPIVILLHGVYASHWAWAAYTHVHRIAAEMIKSGEIPPLILAMPSDGLWGDGSGYLVHARHNYEQWIVTDVPAALSELFPQAKDHACRFIAGLSMGGYGALRLGSKYPDRFAAISGHSSITDREQLRAFLTTGPRDTYDLIGRGDESIFSYMLKNRDALPPIRFDCGIEDPLLPHNRQLHRDLSDQGIPHIYEEFPGGHTWDYWTAHVVDTLRFFGAILKKNA